MEPGKGSIYDLLNGNTQYIVPVYQRKYSWLKDKQCERLWNDIVSMEKLGKRQHFVGSIVNIAETHTPMGIQKYLVIDGQQRMTTLTILMIALRDYLIEKLLKLNDKYGIIHLNTMISPDFAPHIVSVAFKGIRSEVMLHALEDKGIYVSAGSACSSHSKKISNTLISIGLNKELADSTIRISFGKYNTKSEIDILISELDNLIKVLSLKDKR